MKLHTNQNTVDRSSDFQSTSYKIEATAKAFSILSDSLYSNKIKAVVRELSTNAYDAHIAENCPDKPFSVQLPTKLEPVFVVRDFGTGLSHDDCFNLYTTYFGSNKTDSNDAVGCLGLGSKSPFAYTDSFMVESFFNGTHYVYNSYMNESGSPEFALLNKEATDEPNGLRVSMNVDVDDICEFESEATKIYQHFSVRPDTNTELSYLSEETKLSGDDWSIMKANTGNHIIMGQVAYPIDEDQFFTDDDQSIWRVLRQIGRLRLEVNIGDVDITPSREAISYTNRTKRFRISTIDTIVDGLADKAINDIQTAKNLWMARCKIVDVIKSVGNIGDVDSRVIENATWNDQELFPDSRERIQLPFGVVLYSKDRWRETVSREERDYIKASNGDIYYQDKKSGSVARIKKLIKDEGNGSAYLIPEGKLEQACKVMGCDPTDIPNVTTLAAPPKSLRSSSSYSYTTSEIPVMRKDAEGRWDERYQSVSVKEEDAYYVTRVRDNVNMDGQDIQMYAFKRTLESLDEIGVDISHLDGKLFVVTPSKLKSMKLTERDNWSSGDTYLINEIQRQLVIHTRDFELKLNSGDGNWRIGSDNTVSPHVIKGIHGLLKSRGEFYNFSKNFCPDYRSTEKALDLLKSSAGYINLWREFSENLQKNSSNTVEIDEDYDKIVVKYPMLQFISSYIGDEHWQVIADYIDSMEI